jgi:YVTN family beta-propeller protein
LDSVSRIHPKRELQLLIDIKTASVPTLQEVITHLRNYPDLIANKHITFTITGNRPTVEEFQLYPDFIHFDGRPGEIYTQEAIKKVALISDSYFNYVRSGKFDESLAGDVVKKARALGKSFRFWAQPDHISGWNHMLALGVDYINTDKIEELAQFKSKNTVEVKEELMNRSFLHDSLVFMPYNRIIQSAGKVVRFGSPRQENHALDIVRIPNTMKVVVQDRYGIVAIDTSGKIIDRFNYQSSAVFKSLMSTYSGIQSFLRGDTTWIIWSAAAKKDAYLMYAIWKNETFQHIGGYKIERNIPAENAIPNELLYDAKESVVYLVLNGNNQVVKLSWPDKQLIWQKPSGGIAPYGIARSNQKLYVTNWAGPIAADSSKERAGVPWDLAYTDPRTGATAMGTVSILDEKTGNILGEVKVGLHPNVIKSSPDKRFLFVANGNSDEISVIDTKKNLLVETIPIGLFQHGFGMSGSSPVGLSIDRNNKLYVSNGMDNAIAVVSLGHKLSNRGKSTSTIEGYIPTESYPAGSEIIDDLLFVANLESEGANIVTPEKRGRGIHYQFASVSIIPIPDKEQLKLYTSQVYENSLKTRLEKSIFPPRDNVKPKPIPDRIGEPSVFKHIVYIIKENKTYDQVLGDLKGGNGDSSLCVFGEIYTPNMHELARTYGWMDNYYASGKSSAEGHQWSNAAIVSDYVEKNVRTWLRSYPHRQTDALVYNKTGYIWNHAMDHGKSVRIFGEACTTVYDEKLNWFDLYKKYKSGATPDWKNITTIARIDSIISPTFPDNDNMVFSDQQRADVFIQEWNQLAGAGKLPHLMIVSLPNDHGAGLSPNFPTPDAMVADNDLALGRIVEHISNSPFFDSTLILVTQDDSQSGWDHISAYRTVGLAISAYSKKGVTSTNYNQTSMVRTIEQVLGIPPMNIIDATASPMFDLFQNDKNLIRYSHLPNNIPLDKMNKSLSSLKGKERKMALQSMNELFNEVDGGEDEEMNEIVWYYIKKIRTKK